MEPIHKNIRIHANPASVWNTLTDPEQMKIWMGTPEMKLNIQSDWKVGGPFLITGFLHQPFENTGKIIVLESEKRLVYTQLSSLSNLPAIDKNFTIVSLELAEVESETEVSVIIRNFPTESIYEHLKFYWNGTLGVLKQYVEAQISPISD